MVIEIKLMIWFSNQGAEEREVHSPLFHHHTVSLLDSKAKHAPYPALPSVCNISLGKVNWQSYLESKPFQVQF